MKNTSSGNSSKKTRRNVTVVLASSSGWLGFILATLNCISENTDKIPIQKTDIVNATNIIYPWLPPT